MYVSLINLYGCEAWGCKISRESWKIIEQIDGRFIAYNIKIKNNMPYHILLLKSWLSPIESMAIIRYLIYKHKLNKIEDRRVPKIALKSNQNHLRLKRGWIKDATT